METIQEGKAYLRENWEDGCDCPVCGQHVQLYNYKFFASSALALIALYKLSRDNLHTVWFHIKDYAEAREGKGRAHHFAELRFWGLVEKRPYNDDPAKKSSGFWKITDKGISFVQGKLQVPSRILIYDNKFQGFADTSVLVNIHDALGNKFNYQDLMGDYHQPDHLEQSSLL